MGKKGLTNKQKKYIKIGLGVSIVGGLLYWLSQRVKAEVWVVGKTYDFEYIPNVPGDYNIHAFVVPPDFGYNQASDIVVAIEGGTGIGTGSPSDKITRILKWNAAEWNWTIWQYALGQWKDVNFTIASGDIIGVQIISSFSWTP